VYLCHSVTDSSHLVRKVHDAIHERAGSRHVSTANLKLSIVMLNAVVNILATEQVSVDVNE